MKTSHTDSESIRRMFSSISGKYDLANTVLSLGIHHQWRKSLVRWSEARAGRKILDCASGTGDLAFEFEKAVTDSTTSGEVLGTDFCEEMLVQAREKAQARGSKVRFETADVTRLSYENNRFDISSIAFGIRNVSDAVKGLSEMARVTRPGGYVMVLEFGQANVPLWGEIFDFYSKAILPKIGGLITGKPEAYEYLQNSSSKFPCRQDFLSLAEKTGKFDRCEYKSLMGGIAYLYRLRRAS